MSTRDDNDENAFNETICNSPLLTCAFNQDGGYLAVGTTTGFSVHNLYPNYFVSVNRELSGGIGIVEMLFRCNLMVLVGGGPNPQAPPHRALIFDDHQGKPVGELCFRQIVLAVKLRKDSIALALRDRVYVYNLADLTLRDKIYTADNPHGLLSLSTNIQDMVLACPSVTTGHVRVELYGSRKTVLMEAHDSSLRGLALTADGTKLATASEKGTVLRVWDVASSSCLHEFRRGVERATITCLAWSWDHSYLSCTSDKGTAHIFSLSNSASETTRSDKHAPQSVTSMLFTSVQRAVEGDAKKSVCQIRGVPHPLAIAFVASATNVVAVAGWDADGNGVLMLSEFKAGEEPQRVGYHVLCKSANRPDESEEARRRRRLRGWAPEIPQTPEGGRLFVGERLEVLERNMEQIRFEENDDDDEFVSVSTVRRPKTTKPSVPESTPERERPTRPTTDDPDTANNSSNNNKSEKEDQQQNQPGVEDSSQQTESLGDAVSSDELST